MGAESENRNPRLVKLKIMMASRRHGFAALASVFCLGSGVARSAEQDNVKFDTDKACFTACPNN